MSFLLDDDLETFLKSDRQWPHHLRVSHAKMQLEKSASSTDQKFWAAVLRANDKGRLR